MGRAARRLHMAQPPLSTQIKNLETLLGTPLFRRGPRGMEITEAGQALYVRTKEALLLADEGVDAAMAIGQGRRGRLTVGTMVVLSYPLLPGIAEAMRHQMPEVEVQYVEADQRPGGTSELKLPARSCRSNRAQRTGAGCPNHVSGADGLHCKREQWRARGHREGRTRGDECGQAVEKEPAASP